MNRLLLVSYLFLLVSCGARNEKASANEQNSTTPITYARGDLNKIRWIEGRWKGMYKGEPFYEMYALTNDTLSITSYAWDGKDSSKTSRDRLTWIDDAYYLGDKQYKVTVLTDSVIKMIPVRAQNDITWKKRDSTGWDAVLVAGKETNIYHMEWFDPFKQ